MNKAEARDTLTEIPRDYAYCVVDRDRRAKFYFSPVVHAVSEALVTSPARMATRMRRGQYWQRQYHEQGRSLRFPWTKKYLEMPAEDLPGAVREAVRKREGVYKLWDLTPGKAIHEVTIRGQEISARVESKSRYSPANPRIHTPHFRNLFLDHDRDPNIMEMGCNCPHSDWGEAKGGRYITRIECLHIAAMLDWAWLDQYSPSDLRPRVTMRGKSYVTGMFNPFNFADNWHFNGEIYQAKNPELASLQMDMLMAHMAGKNSEERKYLSINRKALTIPWLPSPALQKMMEEGDVAREVISHGKRTVGRDEAVDVDQLAGLFTDMSKALYRHGYEFDGRCLEFGEMAYHFENPNGNVVNLAFPEDDAPFCVVRTNPSNIVRPFEKPKNGDPFLILGKNRFRGGREFRYHDRGMRYTETRIEAPTALRIPETGFKPIPFQVPRKMKGKIKRKIKETFGDRSESREKYARVHY